MQEAAGEAAGIKHIFVPKTCPLFPLYTMQSIPVVETHSETSTKRIVFLFPLFYFPKKRLNLRTAAVAGVQFALPALIRTFPVFCNPSNAL